MPEAVGSPVPGAGAADPRLAAGWGLFGAGSVLLPVAPMTLSTGRGVAVLATGLVLLGAALALLRRRRRQATLQAPRTTAVHGTPPDVGAGDDTTDPTLEQAGDGSDDEDLPEVPEELDTGSQAEEACSTQALAGQDACPAPTPVLVHEIRNPLSAAAGHLDLLTEDPTLTEEQRRSLRTALRGVERASGLIGDYLEDPSRWRPGSLFYDRSPVDLREMLLEALSEYAPMAAERRIAMSLDAPEHVLVRADSRRLRQVVDNLLSNALKYNQAGGWVDVQLGVPEPDEGGAVVLEMSNPGATLAEDDAARAFDPEYRGSEADALASGQGIGLAVVHDVVTAHGGHISLTSCETTRTTTVRMSLPG